MKTDQIIHQSCSNIIRTDYPIKGNYKSWKVEKEFMSDIFKLMRADGYYCYHIPDATLSYRLLDGFIIDPKDGKQFLLEFKKTDGYTFNISQFEPSQIALMNTMDRINSPYGVVIFSRKTNTYVLTTLPYIMEHKNEEWWIKFFSK